MEFIHNTKLFIRRKWRFMQVHYNLVVAIVKDLFPVGTDRASYCGRMCPLDDLRVVFPTLTNV